VNPISATHKARSNFAGQHLAAAKYFQSQVVEIERVGQPSPERFAPPQYYHFWFATVVFSVMALEANVYDLMTTAFHRDCVPHEASQFRAEDHKKPLFERYNLLHKIVMQGERLSLDHGIGQEARLLEKLRNEIVHYKTEWRSEVVVSSKLRSMLHSRFDQNPFCCGGVFFPEQCVSASSATWAVRVAYDFMLNFSATTKLRLNV
jgi:hypothetical protein